MTHDQQVEIMIAYCLGIFLVLYALNKIMGDKAFGRLMSRITRGTINFLLGLIQSIFLAIWNLFWDFYWSVRGQPANNPQNLPQNVPPPGQHHRPNHQRRGRRHRRGN